MFLARRFRFFQSKIVASKSAAATACLNTFCYKSTVSEEHDIHDVSPERWTCSCGFSNFSFRSACFHCHALGPSAEGSIMKAEFSPSTDLSDTAIQSNISLSMINVEKENSMAEGPAHPFSPSRSSSFNSFPQNKSHSTLRPGDWNCACGAHNFSRRTTCFSCKALKNGQISFFIKPGDWICSRCNSHNFKSRTECFCCQVGKTVSADNKVSHSPSTDDFTSKGLLSAPWTCQSCHSINEPHMTSCLVCTAGRPSSSPATKEEYSTTSGSVGTRRHSYPNDWICSSCSFVNFQSRRVCKSCHSQKTEDAQTVGEEGSENTHSVQKSGQTIPRGKDWSCPCGFLNFSFRCVCKSCNSPQPPVDISEIKQHRGSDSESV